MAEEGTDKPVESDKIDYEDDDEEAYSVERLTIIKDIHKISSRYRSEPRSSCHDLCKHGHQNAADTEAKPWKAKRKVTTYTRDRESKAQKENVASSAGMKKSGRISKPCPTSRIRDLNSHVDIKEVIHEKKAYNSVKISQPFEETDASIEHNVKVSSKNQTERKTVKSKSAFGSSSIKQTANSIKQTRQSLTADKEKSMPKSRTLSSKHIVKKTLHVIEPIPPCDESNLSSSPSRNKSLKRTRKNTGNYGVSSSTRKGLRHAGYGTRSSTSVAPLSSLSQGNKKPVIVSRSPSMSSLSSISSYGNQNGGSSSNSSRTGSSSSGERVKIGGYKVKPRMSTTVGAANKVTPPQKLTFRRGKVMEIQPQISNLIRSLQFGLRPTCPLGDDDVQRDINGLGRRGIAASREDDASVSSVSTSKSEKSLSRYQIGEGGKKRIIDGKKVGGNRSKTDDASRAGSDETVVLRRQDAEVVEEKKVNPRLYNNVIEETASMLAELRKSKVKALVGAFETVISLDSSREAAIASEVSTAC